MQQTTLPEIRPEAVSEQLARWGCAPVPALHWRFLQDLGPSTQHFLESWSRLPQDQFMGDGGRYRYRRYSKLRLRAGQLKPLDGNSIHQLLEHNPLNGGVTRVYEPIEDQTLDNPTLRQMILRDAHLLGLAADVDWVVGIHQVRIQATALEAGQSAPEGIHIDAEQFTVQHMISRHNVSGGCFSAYDSDKKPLLHWLQLEPFDSIFFLGTTWHSATPIQPRDPQGPAHRDILLIDFDPLKAP